MGARAETALQRATDERETRKGAEAMYNKILVAMALDHGVSPKTLEIARALRAAGGKIIAIHVLEELPGSSNAELWETLQNE
ncbi:MAG: hypothetical protein HKP29_08880, partial [Silicimonas sp.]|nr:hypothetical protein [Silicimonas sp.]